MLTNNQPQLLAEATGYTLLEPSIVQPNPASASGTPTNISQYLNGAYITMFIIVIVGAVITLVYYGIGYMMSDVTSFKTDAKRRLWNVFIGIAIALLSFILLNEINPDLLKIELSRVRPVVNTVQSTVAPAVNNLLPVGGNQ